LYVVMAGSPPSAETRRLCWTARDRYFNCRVAYNTDEEREKNCAEFQKVFNESCPKSWVKHFFKKQSWEEYKKELLKTETN